MARPALRLRLAPKFPTRLLGGTGIDVATAGGQSTIAMDWSDFQRPVGPFDPGVYDVLAYDPAADDYNLVPLSTSRTANYRVVTIAGPVTVTTSDGDIGIDKTVPEATTVNLLPVASGFPLSVKDVAGNAGTYNITLVPSGVETIDGAASFVMGSNFQSIVLTPVPGGWITKSEYSGDTAVVPGTYTFAAVSVDKRGRVTFIQSGNVPTAPAGVLSNASLAASVGSNALTITLNTADGTAPSLDSGASIPFRSSTPATGAFTQRSVGSATTLVISSGSTMGFANATAGRLWIVAFDDAGTVRLGAVNCRSGVNIFPLAQFGIASSTAEGGAGAADNAHVFYTGTAVTSKAYTVLGYLEWAAGLTTAGTWATVPTRIDTFKPGMKLPGDVVQAKIETNNTYATNGGNVIPADDTVPQNTEGDAISTLAFTPSSSANVLDVSTSGQIGSIVTNTGVALTICRSDQSNCIASGASYIETAGGYVLASLQQYVVAGATSSVNFTNRYGPFMSGSGRSINGGSSARQFGASQAFVLKVKEIVA